MPHSSLFFQKYLSLLTLSLSLLSSSASMAMDEGDDLIMRNAPASLKRKAEVSVDAGVSVGSVGAGAGAPVSAGGPSEKTEPPSAKRRRKDHPSGGAGAGSSSVSTPGVGASLSSLPIDEEMETAGSPVPIERITGRDFALNKKKRIIERLKETRDRAFDNMQAQSIKAEATKQNHEAAQAETFNNSQASGNLEQILKKTTLYNQFLRAQASAKAAKEACQFAEDREASADQKREELEFLWQEEEKALKKLISEARESGALIEDDTTIIGSQSQGSESGREEPGAEDVGGSQDSVSA